MSFRLIWSSTFSLRACWGVWLYWLIVPVVIVLEIWNSSWLWCISLLNTFWILLTNILRVVFLSMLMWEILVCTFSVLWYSYIVVVWIWPQRVNMKSSPAFYFFLEEIVENWCKYFYKWRGDFTSELTWAWCFLSEKLLLLRYIFIPMGFAV